MVDGFDEIGLPPLGHNKPPAGEAEIERIQQLIANANRWIAERPSITDEEQAGAAQTFIDQLNTADADLGKAMKAELAPLAEAEKAIRAKYRDPATMLVLAKDSILRKINDWLKRKRDKLEEERKRKEAAANAAISTAAELQAAAAQPGATIETQLAAQRAHEVAERMTDHAMRAPTKARVKGDYAKRAMSLRSNWKARVIDETAALRHFAKNEEVRAAALEAATRVATRIAKVAKGNGAPPPGFEFYNDERAA